MRSSDEKRLKACPFSTTYAKPVHGDPGIRSVTPDTGLLEPTVLPTLFYHIRTAPTLEHDPLFYKRHQQL
jgi:hypothetical protein